MMTKLTLLMAISLLPSLVSPFTTPNTFDKTSLHLGNSMESRNYALFSEASASQFSQDQDGVADDMDSYLVDNANSTSKFLHGLWELIARGNSMVRGVSDTVILWSRSTFLKDLMVSNLLLHLSLGIRNSSIPRYGIPIHITVSESCNCASRRLQRCNGQFRSHHHTAAIYQWRKSEGVYRQVLSKPRQRPRFV